MIQAPTVQSKIPANIPAGRLPLWVIHLVSLGLLTAAVMVLFLPVLELVVPATDYLPHLRDVELLLAGNSLESFMGVRPHFLFQVLVAVGVQAFPGSSLQDAGFVVALLAYITTALLIYGLCVDWIGRPQHLYQGLMYSAVALVLLLVSPVTLLTTDNQYFGYIPITVYHNPTVTLLRPFALMLFLVALTIIRGGTLRRTLALTLLAIAVTIVTTLAKPNFTIALLPPVMLVAVYQAVRRNWRTCAALLVGVVLPGVIVLYAQTTFFAGGKALTIAPFAVFNAWLDVFYPGNTLGLLPRLILSILFPAYVYLAYREKGVHRAGLHLAWATFGFGAAYTYFLAETGNRLTDGNWTWSGQITLFVLFTVSVLYWIQQRSALTLSQGQRFLWARWRVELGLLALHVVSGLLWYYVHVNPALLKDALHHYY